MFYTILAIIIIAYFLVLLGLSLYTSKQSNNESFFIGNRKSNWLLVAFGMIGTSLSGVTFVSVPGTVLANHFFYLQVVFGYVLGYVLVAYVLLPLYYKMNLTSIYKYLQVRLGNVAYKTGASFFILSRTFGATARLYLVINVLYIFVLNHFQISYFFSAVIILLMILLYTYKGGVKTIVYTDTLQTTGMLIGLIICIAYIVKSSNSNAFQLFDIIQKKQYTQTINTDVFSKLFFVKQIIGGAFITIAMTGLDQEMMQKNISVSTLKLSQKNMLLFSVVMAIVNVLFLLLGALLYVYAEQKNITVAKDDLFPTIALQYFPKWIAIVFVIALISALFPSADGALTALTSSFCIDILNINNLTVSEEKKLRIRKMVHVSFAVVFLICVMLFKTMNDKSVIDKILNFAGLTYGPLLGLFAFGILTKRNVSNGFATVLVCVASPIICYFFADYVNHQTGWFQIGIELLLLNGLLTFGGLFLFSKKKIGE